MSDRFSNMKFPEYEFQEYPKWVEGQDGKPVLVNDADEELATLGVEKREPAPQVATLKLRGGR
jgi:hypothetical protein